MRYVNPTDQDKLVVYNLTGPGFSPLKVLSIPLSGWTHNALTGSVPADGTLLAVGENTLHAYVYERDYPTTPEHIHEVLKVDAYTAALLHYLCPLLVYAAPADQVENAALEYIKANLPPPPPRQRQPDLPPPPGADPADVRDVTDRPARYLIGGVTNQTCYALTAEFVTEPTLMSFDDGGPDVEVELVRVVISAADPDDNGPEPDTTPDTPPVAGEPAPNGHEESDDAHDLVANYG